MKSRPALAPFSGSVEEYAFLNPTGRSGLWSPTRPRSEEYELKKKDNSQVPISVSFYTEIESHPRDLPREQWAGK